jgi:cobalt-precorrin 5A hydrolase
MKIGIVAITEGGNILARRLADKMVDAARIDRREEQKIADVLAESWTRFDGLVCIMAAGIVVRAIAPLLQDKLSDPCVVVMDEKGRHAISLLSGHIGGGNSLAKRVAEITGGSAVITTASDTLGLTALDLWAEEQQLASPERHMLTAAAAILVNRGELKLYTEVAVESLPPGLTLAGDAGQADAIVSSSSRFGSQAIVFRPRNLVVGIGCNRGTPAGEFEDALTELLADLQLSRLSIRNLASIDKKNDETGLLQFAADNRWQIDFFPGDLINTLTNLEISFAALQAVGAIGVAEPAALLSAKSNLLLSRKRKWKNVTMAVAEAPFSLSAQAPAQSSR